MLLITFHASSQTTYTWIGPNNGSWTTSGNWSPTRYSSSTSDILRFNDGTTKTIGSVPSQTVGRLLIQNNTSIVLNAASSNRTLTLNNTVNDALVIESGSSLHIGSGTNFTLYVGNNASADISGRLIIDNGRTYATNTSGTQTVVSSTGRIENEGTVNSTNSNRLVFQAGSVYEHTRNGGTIPTANWDNASTCEVTGITGSVPSGLGQSFGNFTWDCPGQSSNINFGGSFDRVDGNLTIANTNGRRLLMGSNDIVSIDVDGNLEIGSAGNTALLDMDASNGTVTWNLSGDLVTVGNGQINNEGNNNATFNLIRGSGTQYIRLGNTNSFGSDWGGNINIGNGSTDNEVVLQTNMALASTYTTNISVESGSTFNMGSFVISNRGTFSTSSNATIGIGHANGITSSASSGNVQVSSTRSYSAASNYAYTGTTAQVTGSGLPSSVRRLIIDNSAGAGSGAGVTLSQDVNVTTELQLNNGYIQTSLANLLTLNAGTTATAINNAFVAGPMRKTGNTDFTFPTGYAGLNGGRIPIKVSSLSGSATIQAEYKRAPAALAGSNTTLPLRRVSGCEYWELFPTSGSLNTTVTMYWNSYSNCSPVSYVNNFASLVVARSNGTTWTSVGNTGGSMGSGTVISTANTTISNASFRNFSLGSTSLTTNPLPITLTEIKATKNNNDIIIEWTNLTESDISNYVVQRSADAIHFTDIAMQAPSGNTNERADYNITDRSPLAGNNYYRIQVMETTGKIIYSRVVKIASGNEKENIVIYPNPVTASTMTVALSGMKKGVYNFHVIDMAGREFFKTQANLDGTASTQTILLPSGVPAGVYTLMINGDNYTANRPFIVK